MNITAVKFDVVVAESVADGLLVFARQFKHGRIEVDADHFALGADDLGDDVAGLAAAAAKVEHRFTAMNIAGRIAATIVLFNDLGRDNSQ